jgi:DNA-binding NtrC family response regulator
MASDSATAPAPRVLIVMPDQWTRALLRAALREDGYDAVGSRGVREALRVRPDDPERGPVRLIVVDQDALAANAPALFPALRDRLGRPETLLIRRGTRSAPNGEWGRVLQRPVSVADIVEAVRTLAPLPAGARHPIDL